MNTQPKPLPKWREDFPIEQEFDDHITRRDFVRFLGLVSAGLLVGNASIFVRSLAGEEGPFPEVTVSGAEKLEPGNWMTFHYPDERHPAILIRRENGTYIAFHQKCPHLACPVSYHRSDGDRDEHIGCHCHNGRFDIATGKGTQGPPRELRPLRQVVLRVEQDRIVATGLNEVRIV